MHMLKADSRCKQPACHQDFREGCVHCRLVVQKLPRGHSSDHCQVRLEGKSLAHLSLGEAVSGP